MKKKKKKQVALDVEETTPEVAEPAPVPAPEPVAAPAPVPAAAAPAVVEEKADSGVATPVEGEAGVPAEDGADLFADLKKKKKKKELPLDLDTAEAAPVSVEGLDVTKKKKSKKAADDFARELDEMDAEDGEAGDLGEGEDEGDDPFARAEGGAEGAVESGKEAWVLEGRDPTYPELLSRFFYLLHQHNPELAGEKRRYTIVPPQVAREGTKKTVFANITDICRRLHRQPEHVIQFLYSELGTQGSIDGAQRLVMKGRYTQKQIENVLRKYITEYVTCKICKSPDTLLGKENRLYFMTCESCGSRRSVSAIKAGFKAQIGKRIKAA